MLILADFLKKYLPLQNKHKCCINLIQYREADTMKKACHLLSIDLKVDSQPLLK